MSAQQFPECLKAALDIVYSKRSHGISNKWNKLVETFAQQGFQTIERLLMYRMDIKKTLAPHYLSNNENGSEHTSRSLWFLSSCDGLTEGLKLARKKAQSTVNRAFATLCSKILKGVVSFTLHRAVTSILINFILLI